MSLKKCGQCGSSMDFEWTRIEKLDGWLGKGACPACGHVSVHLSGSPEFQHKAKQFIAVRVRTRPFGF